MAATEYLWAATGRQYGSCEVEFRPCTRSCFDGQPYGGWWWYPDRWVAGWPYGPVAGGWLAAACGRCQGSCSCTSAAELVLPHPAQEIVEVSVDGAVLPSSAYILYNGLTLVRTDGELWPFCQDWGSSSGPGTFVVKARFGRPVPALGSLAMGELMPEIMKACKSGGDCRLPSGTVQSITRQGVTKTFVDPTKLGRLTGLPLVDKFIQTENPHGLDEGARIWDPEALLEGRVEGGAW